MRRDLGQLLLSQRIDLDEQGTIARQHTSAERGQLRTTAMRAAWGRLYQRLIETAIHHIDQLPGPAIGHLHALGRRGDGTGLADRVEQVGLAWPHGGQRAIRQSDLKGGESHTTI